jgi:protein-disulfide isomerase
MSSHFPRLRGSRQPRLRLTRLRLPRLLLLCFAAAACGPDSGTDADRQAAGGAAAATFRDPGYTLGAPDARVTVIEFSDFGCPYCRVFALTTYPAIHRDFVATGRVRWRYVPFVLGRFPNGNRAAMAAECAADQDETHFWRLREQLYETQAEWSRSRDADELLVRLAARVGLNESEFAACLAADAAQGRIDRSNRMAALGSVSGTPAFFIGARRVYGALSEESFRQLLDEALGPPPAP